MCVCECVCVCMCVCVQGPLLLRALSLECVGSVVAHMGSLVMAHGLSCLVVCGILGPYQGLNHIPWIGRQILKHWTTRNILM